MKVSDYIAKKLAEKRVPAVFELVGGMITHLLDSIHVRNETKIVSMHHEQGAAFAAEAAGRVSGRPGVAMATSGPGATNLLTGIASCYFDSSPAVFITGQVNRDEQKRERPIRQLGFQETDIAAMAAPVTKRIWKIENELEVPQALEDAFRVASSGRKGPVLIDIPMDVQRADLSAHETTLDRTQADAQMTEQDAVEILEACLRAKRPIVLAGGGVRSGNAAVELRKFIDLSGIPMVYSLMGKDLLEYSHVSSVGMIGSYGNRWANLALAESDCLIVLGSRLDVRQTGADTEAFRGTRQIFHIDCDHGEVNNRIENCTAKITDLLPALTSLCEVFRPLSARLHAKNLTWAAHIASERLKWPDVAESTHQKGINPNCFMHSLSRGFTSAAAYVVDVGQHQMWAAQSLELEKNQRFLTSGGLGSMGFALPAAVGASVCLPDSLVVAIAGDGGFQCNIQELQTVVRLGLRLKLVVINNGCHGMVRQFQQSYFGSRYQSTMWGYSAPDFEKIARAYGIPAHTVSEQSGVDDAIGWLGSDEESASLLQVMISPEAQVYPKLAYGRGLESMEPHAQPLGMEGT